MTKGSAAMRRTNYKPSKPVAIFGIVVGIGMLGFGITALNTRAAFSEKGSLGTFVSDDDDDAERDRPKPFL